MYHPNQQTRIHQNHYRISNFNVLQNKLKHKEDQFQQKILYKDSKTSRQPDKFENQKGVPATQGSIQNKFSHQDTAEFSQVLNLEKQISSNSQMTEQTRNSTFGYKFKSSKLFGRPTDANEDVNDLLFGTPETTPQQDSRHIQIAQQNINALRLPVKSCSKSPTYQSYRKNQIIQQ